MKFRSLTGRLIVTVICIETLLALCITLIAVDYQRRESLNAFDVMLRGRADSVLGAVQDAEDAGDNVLLDKTSINVPANDVYEVREENGAFIGSSDATSGALSSQLSAANHPQGSLVDDGKVHRLRLGDGRYRAIVQHRLRLIDPDEPGAGPHGKGMPHRLVIFYAASSRPVHIAIVHAVRFFALADLVALLLSIAVVMLLIRRGLQPLGDLATQAAQVSPRTLNFRAPDTAYQLSELAPLASALDTALQGLERAFRQQRSFVNDAAHELKTAVTLLKSSLQLLTLRDRTKSQYQAGIEGCLADCGRMEELVQRMLLLARVEQEFSSGLKRSQQQVPMAELLYRTVTQLEAAAALRQISISRRIEDELSSGLSEEDSVTLFTNLLLNAIQHSGPGSTITVRLAARGASNIEFSIRDQGVGIAAEHLPFVFDRFYRTDASRSRDTGGTGLGLAICKAIVEANGGVIQMESVPAQGTTVTVTLPAKPGFSSHEAASTMDEARLPSV